MDAGPVDSGSSPPDAGPPPVDAGPPTIVRTYDIWLWNVAGHTMHAGATDTGVIEAAVSSIQSRGVDLVGFNELCRSQYRALIEALSAAGWPSDSANFARFSETRSPSPGVCAGSAYGNAIFSRWPLGGADRVTLPSDGSVEHRSLLCAPLQARPHLRFCTTHITTSSQLASDGVAHNVRQLPLRHRPQDRHDLRARVRSGGELLRGLAGHLDQLQWAVLGPPRAHLGADGPRAAVIRRPSSRGPTLSTPETRIGRPNRRAPPGALSFRGPA